MNWKYILIVAILAVVVGGGILAYQYWLVPPEDGIKPPEVETPKGVPLGEIPVDETADWKTYENSKFGFSINYLKNLEVSEGLINGVGDNFPVVSFNDPSDTREMGNPYNLGNITIFKGISAIQANRPSNYPYYPFTSPEFISPESLETMKIPTLKMEEVSINDMPAKKFIYVNIGPSVFFYWIEHNDIALKIELDKNSMYPRDLKDYIDLNSLQFIQ